MAKIADLLAHTEDTQGAEWYVRFAQVLGISLDQARALYNRWGNGRIYASMNFVRRNATAERRARIARRFGKCIIVEEDGTMWVKTAESIGRMNRIKHHREDTVEYRQMRKQRDETRKQRDCERMFEDGKGRVCRKHQGKGDSLADLGKYNNVFRRSMSDSIPRVQVRYVEITIG